MLLMSSTGYWNKVSAQTIDNFLLGVAFTDPIDPWSSQTFFIDDEITDVASLKARLAYLSFDINDMLNGYANTQIDTAYSINSNILKLECTLNNKPLFPHAYLRPGLPAADDSVAFVFIPELHPGYANLYNNNPLTSALGILRQKGDVFIHVKPNEAFRTIYSNGKRINATGLFAENINKGKSYPATIFVEALALIKYVQTKYPKVIVIGTAHAGYMALLLSLQSNPTSCIVVSGYSSRMDPSFSSKQSFPDFIVPGLAQIANPQAVKSAIDTSSTKFLFQFNDQDRNPYLQYEAQDHYTETFLGVGANKQYEYLSIPFGNWDKPWDAVSLLQFLVTVLP